jgi:hypothetical protein
MRAPSLLGVGWVTAGLISLLSPTFVPAPAGAARAATTVSGSSGTTRVLTIIVAAVGSTIAPGTYSATAILSDSGGSVAAFVGSNTLQLHHAVIGVGSGNTGTPALSVSISPHRQSLSPGGTARFTVTVSNTGDVYLSGVNVTDATAPPCVKGTSDVTAFNDLAPGASSGFSCSLAT